MNKPMVCSLVLFSLAALSAQADERVHFKCDLTGPRQVCVGKTVLVDSYRQGSCLYVITDIASVCLRNHHPFDIDCELADLAPNLSYSIQPALGEPCAAGRQDPVERARIQIRTPRIGDLHEGNTVWPFPYQKGPIAFDAASDCKGVVKQLFEHGTALVQANENCTWQTQFLRLNEYTTVDPAAQDTGTLPIDIQP